MKRATSNVEDSATDRSDDHLVVHGVLCGLGGCIRH